MTELPLPCLHATFACYLGTKGFVHILLSTIVLSILGIAALQALLLALQEWRLHHRHPGGIIRFLPPLEVMEKLLFKIIKLGFIILSLLLITSLFFFHPILSPLMLSKALISFCAWLLFAVLLLGRYYGGWRGQTAVFWTLIGVSLLVVIYFGSEFVFTQN